MPKVIFEINPEKEYEYQQLFCKTPEFEGMTIFSCSPIDDKPRILKKINNFWDDVDKEIVKKIEKEWRVIEDDYFRLIEKITEKPWLHENYHAYFLAFSTILGFSNPFNLKSNEIALTIGAVVLPKFLVGHELFHSHYYNIVEKMGLTKRLNRSVFTEGVASLALFETEAINLFPGTDTESSINSCREVRAKWPILLEYWHKRSSFDNFLSQIDQDTRL